MAISSVQYNPVQKAIETREKKGGGGIGQAAGLVAGAALAGGAAAATGGTALPIAAAAMGGAGGGAALGGMLGEKISPSRQGSTAMDRRMSAAGPQLIQSEPTKRLRESIMALNGQPDDIKQQYGPTLVNGFMSSLAQDNKRTA